MAGLGKGLVEDFGAAKVIFDCGPLHGKGAADHTQGRKVGKQPLPVFQPPRRLLALTSNLAEGHAFTHLNMG